jgi:flagellar biosynthetic protein FliR
MIDLPVGGLQALVGPLFAALGVRHGAADGVQLLTLALARWLPLLALCPFLGGRLVPVPVRMGLGLLLALFVLPRLSTDAPLPLAYSSLVWWSLLLREAFLGILLGLASGLVFWAADIAGRFIDTARGTTTANALIPQMQVQTSLLGDFYFQLFLVIFLVAGGGRLFLATVFESYLVIPATTPGLALGDLAPSFIAATGRCFVIALKLMAPPLAVLIMLDLVLGVANRMAPQLDVFFLSMSLKSAVGALVAGLSLYYLLAIAPGIFRAEQRWIAEEVHRLAPRPAPSPASPR